MRIEIILMFVSSAAILIPIINGIIKFIRTWTFNRNGFTIRTTLSKNHITISEDKNNKSEVSIKTSGGKKIKIEVDGNNNISLQNAADTIINISKKE